MELSEQCKNKEDGMNFSKDAAMKPPEQQWMEEAIRNAKIAWEGAGMAVPEWNASSSAGIAIIATKLFDERKKR